MIVTNPKVVEYIEKLEELESSFHMESEELSEQSQIVLYTITKVFKIDAGFRATFTRLFEQYTEDLITLPREEFANQWASILKFTSKNES